MSRKPPWPTVAPPPRTRSAPETHQPTSFVDAEVTLARVRAERDKYRVALQAIVKLDLRHAQDCKDIAIDALKP